MTVILVLLTFVTFLLIDYFYSRKRVVVQPALAIPKHVPQAQPVPAMVGGFKVPENLRYHPGHTWALSESPNLVRVGMDDFASKLIGHLERIALPQTDSGSARARSSPRFSATAWRSTWCPRSRAALPT